MEKLLLFPLLIVIAACTTPRDDRTHGCEQLATEYAENTKAAVKEYNAGRTTAPQGDLYVSKNQGIKLSAERKGCNTSPWPKQPIRLY